VFYTPVSEKADRRFVGM